MSNPRNYEYFICAECGAEWQDYSPYAQDPTDSSPFVMKTLCEECFEERNLADLKEREAVAQ